VKHQKGTWLKIIAIDLLMLCNAFSISVIGQMFDSIKQTYSLTLSQAGLLLSVQSVGGFVVAVIIIFFIDSFNKKKVVVLSGIMLCLLLISVGILSPLPVLFLIFIMLGFFTGMVDTLTNAVMSEIVSANPEKYISFMHMLFSLGAIIAPILSFAIFAQLGLTGVFFVMGGVALLWSLYSLFAFKTDIKKQLLKDSIQIKYRVKEFIKVVKTPGVKPIAYVAFMVCAWQLTAMYYLSSFFSGITGNVSGGALALSVFFLGMMVSRLLYARVANKFSQGLVLSIGSVLGAFSWAIALFVTDITAKTLLAGVTAFFCANNIPISFAAACKVSPNNTATATGIVTFGRYLALFIFLPVIGAIGEQTGLNNALYFAAIPLIFAIPGALMLHQRMKCLAAK
jgi:MFS family permease